MIERRHRMYYQRKQFERAIAPQVRAERERAQDVALLVRVRAASDFLCRPLI